MNVTRIITVKPRGFCAGVDRAIKTVEECLELFGKPIYIKHEILHNKYVVDRLHTLGAITVKDLNVVPDGSIVIFSAHGSPPEHYAIAKSKNLRIIDATCPLVSKVHIFVHLFKKKGYKIIYIGHKGHAEAVGVVGESPEDIFIVDTIDDVNSLDVGNAQKLVYLTQTTLSVDDTKGIIRLLKIKYPQLEDPLGETICYATTNRQNAIKELAKHVDFILVVGSKFSSNSVRLVETAKGCGVNSILVDGVGDLNENLFEGISVVGISSGASVPENLVQDVINYFVKNGAEKEEIVFLDENVKFTMPKELRHLKKKLINKPAY